MVYILESLRLWIEHVILALGYTGIAAVMLLENVFPPIPSELVMPFGGFLAGRGELRFAGVVLAGTAGSVLGALVLYAVGAWAGEAVVRRGVRRYGRYWLITEGDLDRALAYFAQYGWMAVLAGRLVPLVRSLVSLPAGMARMPLGPFLAYTAVGSTAWTAALALAGLLLGEQWDRVLWFVKQYEHAVLTLLAGSLLIALVRRPPRVVATVRRGAAGWLRREVAPPFDEPDENAAG